MIHRVASSERYNDELITIQRDWNLIDLLDANQVLDTYALEEQRAADEIKRKNK
jgi:hypothetical protein